ncbi:MAG TPA: type II toxin-antitoxin system VapC family toxin [Longimicrobium sp.]|nr:type II toxin-antitoxin system VapC family toxin [Longimicrobium sp.]
MNSYLDTSALLKAYVIEAGSQEFAAWLGQFMARGTSEFTRLEMVASFGRLARGGGITEEEAEAGINAFLAYWPHLYRLPLSRSLRAEAEAVAWTYRLKTADCIHLATALRWQTLLNEPVTLATFDRELWNAAGAAGLQVWPDDLAPFLGRPHLPAPSP